MGQLYIPGDGSFPALGFNTYSSISEIETAGNPTQVDGVWGPEGSGATTIWSGACGSIGTSDAMTGSSHNNRYYYTKYDGTSGTYDYLDDYDYCYIYAFRIDDGQTTPINYVIWIASWYDTDENPNYQIAHGNFIGKNVLYRSEGDIPSFVEEERDWYDTPTEDPDDPEGLDPMGGEFADRGDFAETYLQTALDIPNPAGTMTMDYGGFLRTYALNQQQLTSISSALFAPSFWTGLKQKFEGLSDPLSMIVNCIQLPVSGIGGSLQTMKIGGVTVEDGEGHEISVNAITTRYTRYVTGSVTLKEIWGSAKDYSDVSISIFLPYVGMKELDPDIVVGTSMTLYINIDIWTGDVVYLLHVSNADAHKKYFTMQSVPYRWSGNCSKTVPVGRVDNTNKILGMIGAVAGLSAGVMLGGVGVAGSMGAMGLASQGMAGATAAGFSGLGTAKLGLGIAGATAAKSLHSGFKPTVQSSSGVSGAPGQMDYQYAYLVVKRGVPKYPNGWLDTIGAPNYQTFSGVSMTGYTLFSEIHLTGMGDAAEEERAELERILCEEGIIL